jgi:hypothetical protein
MQYVVDDNYPVLDDRRAARHGADATTTLETDE